MNRPQGVHPSVYELAERFSSVSLMGPPISDKLARLVEHLFTPEEATVAVALPNYLGKPAEAIAKKLKREQSEIQPSLDSMAEKRIILRLVRDNKVTYALLPIIPGMFEMALMKGDDSEWHRQYAKLFEELFSTGYVRDYYKTKLKPGVKNIPIETSLPMESEVVSSDRFSELLMSHQDFVVVNVCQCRQKQHFLHNECKRSKPEDGCLGFGGSSTWLVDENHAGRRISREEMRDIATERMEKGLVFLTGNVKFSNPNAICTCCNCCCEGLRSINEFGAKGIIAPPHFIASVENELCNDCGKCAKICNTYAHKFENKKHLFDASKCIGCGYCITSCKEKAIKMVVNPAHKPPSENFLRLGLKLLPQTIVSLVKAKLTR